MISFSKQTKDAWTTLSGTPANLVNDRIYFVEGVGTFIYTTSGGLKDYNASSAVTDNITGWVDTNYISKINPAVGGDIPGITEGGELSGTGYSIGTTSATGFGADNKLATETGAKAYADQVSAFIDGDFAHQTTGTTNGTLFVNNGSGDLSDTTAKIGDSEKTGFGKSDEVAIESAVTGYVADQIAAIPKLSGENNGPVVIDVTAGNIVSGELLYNESQFKVESGTGKLQAALSGAKGEVLQANADTGLVEGTGKVVGDITSAGFGLTGEIAVESAVTGFVASEIAKVNNAAKDAISGITFSNSTAQISYTKINGAAAVPVTETLSGLVSDASMDGKTLTLTTRGSTVPNITADIEGLVSSFTYDDGKITLGIKGGSLPPINLPAEQFLKDVKTYTVPASGVTADVTGVFTQAIPADTFAGISGVPGIVFQFGVVDDPNTETAGNAENYRYTFVSVQDLVHDYNTEQFELDGTGKLTLKSIPESLLSGYDYATKTYVDTQDGIVTGWVDENYATKTYVDTQDGIVTGWVDENYAKKNDLSDGLSGKIDKVLNETGEVPQFKADGNIESTGKKVGTELSGALASPTANTLATEAAVNGWVTDLLSFK